MLHFGNIVGKHRCVCVCERVCTPALNSRGVLSLTENNIQIFFQWLFYELYLFMFYFIYFLCYYVTFCTLFPHEFNLN